MTYHFSQYSVAIAALVALGILNMMLALTSDTTHSTGAVYIINSLFLLAILLWQFRSTGREESTTDSSNTENNHELYKAALNFQALGKLDTAYRIYKRCEPSQKLITLLSNLAADYIIIGRKSDAVTVYQYALSLQPSNSSIKVNIDNLINADNSFDHPDQFIAKRFQLIKQLGKGSHSSVYLASDSLSSNQLVALKIMNIHTSEHNQLGDELLKRFLREATLASSLNHPNIIGIIDSGESGNIAYIAMEHVNGLSLREHADSTKLLPAYEVLDLISQCAEGLHYAHKKGIVHRDVKPANILLDQTKKIAKLSDFGIARIADSTQTIAGSMLGTPYYMSPEQLVGLEFDARSDIFSLGATLFRLLTGTTPFMGNSMAELMKAIVNEPHRDLSHFRPNLPQQIIQIVDKCLEKEPRHRYNSAKDLADELRQCVKLINN